MNFVDQMQRRALDGFDQLFRGVSQLYLADFPDHANVGDSAIALGELRYFAMRNIEVLGAKPWWSVGKAELAAVAPVTLQGGGNFGGLYPINEQLRYRFGSSLPRETLLIQAPQSVEFVNTDAERRFQEQLARRENARIAVRDQPSFDKLLRHFPEVQLMPDAVHVLGNITGPSPTKRVVVLARTDDESNTGRQLTPAFDPIDWITDDLLLRASTHIRLRAKYIPGATRALSPSVKRWTEIAEKRLKRGVVQLAPGEVIVTDRLHAMLIAIQMGRQVVAVDNRIGKLSNYAETWFESMQPDVRFATNFSEAVRAAGGGGS